MNSMGTINLYDTSEYYDEKKEKSRKWSRENKKRSLENNKQWYKESKGFLKINEKWKRAFSGREELA